MFPGEQEEMVDDFFAHVKSKMEGREELPLCVITSRPDSLQVYGLGELDKRKLLQVLHIVMEQVYNSD